MKFQILNVTFMLSIALGSAFPLVSEAIENNTLQADFGNTDRSPYTPQVRENMKNL